LGAAVILLAVGGLATVGTQDTWLDGYGIIAYGDSVCWATWAKAGSQKMSALNHLSPIGKKAEEY
jgi:hypothetical protein